VTCGGDSGNRIFVLYWRYPLIRVSVIRGSTVFYNLLSQHDLILLRLSPKRISSAKLKDTLRLKNTSVYTQLETWHCNRQTELLLKTGKANEVTCKTIK
jgi:hypothetical protein